MTLINYYDLMRLDIIEEVPLDIDCLLSVGCGAGRSESELVKKGINVFGIELNHNAATIARQRGISVLEGDVSAIDIGSFHRQFDFIIYADVLEHLPDPVTVLRDHLLYLKPGGKIYISVPNFRHFSVFSELFLWGRVDYKDAGILDRTHIRFTTRKMVQEWFCQVGLTTVNYKYIIHGRRYRLISACLLGCAREFLASQIGLLAIKPIIEPEI